MRGYQKRVIFVKNTGSRHIEEAYFVMRSDVSGAESSRQEIVAEADRIIRESFGDRGRGYLYVKRWYILSFLIGCAMTAAACMILRIVL